MCVKNKTGICEIRRSFDLHRLAEIGDKTTPPIAVISQSAFRTLLSWAVLAEMAEDHCLTKRKNDPVCSFAELICRMNADNLNVQLMKQGYIKETEMS